ncbi:MAG: type I methionyl aminopeptidase [Actinobacteria bacterium HGW-Actinobacteria-1]|nr:MAG: type I methionyl aminopeptidase [Actinobacteria bacterium HGW-Actinobacteria-1]
MIVLKSPVEIEMMREAGRVTAVALRLVGEAVRPGITTGELDAIAEEYIRSQGAKPAFLGYHGFPATLCTSVNEQVVHGIPGKRILNEGDILSVDCGAVVDGFFGDSAMTFPVGMVSAEARALMDATQTSLEAGIAKMRPNMRLYDIGAAVQQVAEAAGFSVVREYVGHGIGRAMHEDPQVPNFGQAGRGAQLKPGMVFAVEPMVNAGGFEVRSLDDGWTVVTADGSLSAHFEHTIAVTEDGPVILTVE